MTDQHSGYSTSQSRHARGPLAELEYAVGPQIRIGARHELANELFEYSDGAQVSNRQFSRTPLGCSMQEITGGPLRAAMLTLTLRPGNGVLCNVRSGFGFAALIPT